MKQGVKIITICFLVGLLVLIRMFEYQFFYDPFMHFFDQGYGAREVNFSAGMFFNAALRFFLNTLISLSILYVAYKSVEIVKFAGVIFGIFFVVLFPLFIYLMEHVQPDNYLAAFYVRRFLVHPVLILVLLPAFYYFRLQTPSRE